MAWANGKSLTVGVFAIIAAVACTSAVAWAQDANRLDPMSGNSSEPDKWSAPRVPNNAPPSITIDVAAVPLKVGTVSTTSSAEVQPNETVTTVARRSRMLKFPNGNLEQDSYADCDNYGGFLEVDGNVGNFRLFNSIVGGPTMTSAKSDSITFEPKVHELAAVAAARPGAPVLHDELMEMTQLAFDGIVTLDQSGELGLSSYGNQPGVLLNWKSFFDIDDHQRTAQSGLTIELADADGNLACFNPGSATPDGLLVDGPSSEGYLPSFDADTQFISANNVLGQFFERRVTELPGSPSF